MQREIEREKPIKICDYPPVHRKILNDELGRRTRKNHKYSIRAFARDLGIHSGYLTQILNGKKRLTIHSAVRVAKRLEVDSNTLTKFFESIVAEYVANASKRDKTNERKWEL